MKGTPTTYSPRKKPANKVTPPRAILRINADIAMKNLDLHEVASAARLNYSLVSGILRGRVVRPQHVPVIRTAVASFPNP